MATIQTIWLDCDPGLDDALAILLAAHHQRINLIGISTSAGNTSLENTTKNALDLLFNSGKQTVPVIQGSNQLIKGQMNLATHMHGSNGLGGVQIPHSPESAIHENNFETIYKYIIAHDQPVTWANTGSLTNLCYFLRQFPDVTKKLKQIVIMGGSTGRGNITPAAEFNIYFDPQAFDEVLKLKQQIPLVMIPLDTTSNVLCREQIYDYLFAKKEIPLANALYVMLRSYQTMYKRAYEDVQYPMIHDPCVIYYILYPEKFLIKKCKIEVDLYETSYGRTNVHYNDPVHPEKEMNLIDKVSLKLHDLDGFWNTMTQIFAKIFQYLTHHKLTQIQ